MRTALLLLGALAGCAHATLSLTNFAGAYSSAGAPWLSGKVSAEKCSSALQFGAAARAAGGARGAGAAAETDVDGFVAPSASIVLAAGRQSIGQDFYVVSPDDWLEDGNTCKSEDSGLLVASLETESKVREVLANHLNATDLDAITAVSGVTLRSHFNVKYACGGKPYLINYAIFIQVEADSPAISDNFRPGAVYLATTAQGFTGACLYTMSAASFSEVAKAASAAAAVDGTADASESSEDSAEDSGGSCFPADATAELESGAKVPMHALRVGDRVKVGSKRYSEVFMFTHRLHRGEYEFVNLSVSSPSSDDIELQLSAGHYLPVNGELKPAGTVAVGDTVELGDGSVRAVTRVGVAVSGGLFNPQTVDGSIVVNGVLASTYTTAVKPAVAHALLWPMRRMFCARGAETDPSFGLFEGGVERFEALRSGLVRALQFFQHTS